MVLDHLNTTSGLNALLLQAVGRLAFPLFALVWRPPPRHAGRPEPPLADGAAGPAWFLAGFSPYRRGVMAGQYPVQLRRDGPGGAFHTGALQPHGFLFPADAFQSQGPAISCAGCYCY